MMHHHNTSANNHIIGNNIRNLRKNLGIHRDVFAERIGIEGGHLYRLEEGFHAPNANIIRNICVEYEVSADKLLGIKHDV